MNWNFKICSKIQFIVVDELSVPIILGMKGIKIMNMVIDVVKERITIGNIKYPFINMDRSVNVMTMEDTTIDARSMRMIKMKGNFENCIYSIENASVNPNIIIEDGGISADEGENEFYVIIKNLSEQKINIPKNYILAKARNPLASQQHQEAINNIQDNNSESRIKREQLIIGPQVSNNMRNELFKVIKEEEKIFQDQLTEEIREDKIPKYSIKLKPEATPHIAAMGRQAPDKETILEQQVQDLLSRGLIEAGDGSWRARVILVKKKDGKRRRCIDYRVLNDMTITDSYPMVRIDETLDQLGKAKFFSKLDMVEGYYQIPLDNASKEYTGFATRSGFYQWKYLPMGFKNAGAAFQRQMDTVIGKGRFKFCIPYIDDIVIYSDTFEEHLEHLKFVFAQFRKFGLYVKLSKCEFCMERMEFLGHEVSDEGVRPNMKKVKAIVEMPTPKDSKSLVRFLAMAGFYRRYIKDFSKKTHALRLLNVKNTPWIWNEEHQKEYDDIKNALISEPIMAYPDWDKKFILTTDASYKGLGAILSQQHSNGERVIAYASRTLAANERKWGITELEALAVIWGTQQFNVYLESRKFDLITDHKALLAFKNIKDSNPRLERWSIKLSKYDYEVIYRKGNENVNADCLSRDPINLMDSMEIINKLDYVHTIDILNIIVKDLIEKQEKDKDIIRIKKLIIEKGRIEFIRKENDEVEIVNRFKVGQNQWFIEKRGIIYNRIYSTNKKQFYDRYVLPHDFRKMVLDECHGGHFDFSRTYEKIKERFYWSGMVKDTALFVDSCIECQRRNHAKPFKRGLMFSPKASRKFELLGIDLYKGIPKGSVTGYDVILVMTDYITKWTAAVPIKNAKADTVAEAVYENWIVTLGPPEGIISDGGKEFTAKELWKEIYDIFKIKKFSATPYHQQTNGQCERFNRTMSGMLAKYIGEDQKDWEKYLKTCVWEYNVSIHSTTGESPYFMIYGKEPRLPIDFIFEKPKIDDNDITIKRRISKAIKRMELSRKMNKKRYDDYRTNEKFNIGDFVLWRQEPRTNKDIDEFKKLMSPWYGPVTIKKDCGENKYIIIDDENIEKIINVENIKKFTKRPTWMSIENDNENIGIDKNDINGEHTAKSNDNINSKNENNNKINKHKSKNGSKNTMSSNSNPTNIRKSTRQLWKPEVGDKIDIRFFNKEDGRKYWHCGKIEEKRTVNDDIKIKFKDGKDNDWYTLKEEEFRKCEESHSHQRSAEPCLVISNENESFNRKKRRRLEMKRKDGSRKGSKERKKVKELEITERREQKITIEESGGITGVTTFRKSLEYAMRKTDSQISRKSSSIDIVTIKADGIIEDDHRWNHFRRKDG